VDVGKAAWKLPTAAAGTLTLHVDLLAFVCRVFHVRAAAMLKARENRQSALEQSGPALFN
jgi:hypothetical protein